MKILVPLAEGLEEIEAITSIDVLRRAGLEVITAAIEKIEVMGSHNIILKADMLIENINADEFDAIVLPGGMPGSANLRENRSVISLVQSLFKNKKMVAAICAAPIVLEAAGILKNRKSTSYPGFNREMPSCNYSKQRIVIDDNIITGRGPGVAMEFAITLVEYLLGEDKSFELKKSLLVSN